MINHSMMRPRASAASVVASTFICCGSIRAHAGQRLFSAFIGPGLATPALRHNTARRASEVAVPEVGVVEKPVGGVRVAKSGLSPDLQWITDPWDRGVLFSVKVDEVVHDVRSKFQHVQVSAVCSMKYLMYSSIR